MKKSFTSVLVTHTTEYASESRYNPVEGRCRVPVQADPPRCILARGNLILVQTCLAFMPQTILRSDPEDAR